MSVSPPVGSIIVTPVAQISVLSIGDVLRRRHALLVGSSSTKRHVTDILSRYACVCQWVVLRHPCVCLSYLLPPGMAVLQSIAPGPARKDTDLRSMSLLHFQRCTSPRRSHCFVSFLLLPSECSLESWLDTSPTRTSGPGAPVTEFLRVAATGQLCHRSTRRMSRRRTARRPQEGYTRTKGGLHQRMESCIETRPDMY